MGKGNEATRRTRSVVLTFYACGTNPHSTADPWHWILHKRINDFRRAWVKRPHLRTKMQEIIDTYAEQNTPGTPQDDPTPQYTIPMPRGKHVKGGKWLWDPRPPGPIALLLQSASIHNSIIDTSFNHTSPYTQQYNILLSPIHYVKRSIYLISGGQHSTRKRLTYKRFLE